MRNKYEFNILDSSIILNALKFYKANNELNSLDDKGLKSVFEKVVRINKNIMKGF